MNQYYAGIGSRGTPPDILSMMTAIAVRKQIDGCILRSGAAIGAGSGIEIFVANYTTKENYFGPPTPEAIALSAKFHPAWDKCSQFAKLLHGRNAHIILGRDLKTPVDIVICWTEDGKGGGGMGQGIRIANGYGIEVRDLGLPYWRGFYKRILEEK